jgi:hypothetical protein
MKRTRQLFTLFLIGITALLFSGCKDISGAGYPLRSDFTMDEIAQLPRDKYGPGDPEVSMDNFRDTITNAGYVWVQYALDKPSPKPKKNGEMFWNQLKEYYGKQVDGFITILVPEGSDFMKLVRKHELTQDAFPSYCLYKNGIIVSDGTDYDIRVRGVPSWSDKWDVKGAFDYIDKHSSLKRVHRPL